jgi:hypothetical protein
MEEGLRASIFSSSAWGIVTLIGKVGFRNHNCCPLTAGLDDEGGSIIA